MQGRVLYGENPVANARITFVPIEAPKPPDIPAYPAGRTDAEGRFLLSTFKKDDGAPAGKYKVLVVWPKTLGRSDGSGEGEEGDRFEGRYSTLEVSPIEVEIKPEKNDLPPFVLN